MARRDHAVDAGGAVLPRTAQLMRQSLGLGLGRDLKGLRVRGLRGPPLHDYLADRLPRVEFLLGSVWTDDALRLESRKVATESVAPERGHRRIGAEISIHPFKEILVVPRGRPLQTSIRVALKHPRLRRILEGLPGRSLFGGLRSRGEDGPQLGSGILRGEMIRRRKWPIASAPDDCATRGLPPRVPHVGRTQTPSVPSLSVPPIRVERPPAPLTGANGREAGGTRIGHFGNASITPNPNPRYLRVTQIADFSLFETPVNKDNLPDLQSAAVKAQRS
jgi:hypothetical protein